MKAMSFLADIIEDYKQYRYASGRDSFSYIKNILFFDNFCFREYPNATELSQEMVDTWCRQRDTETTTNSCVSRIYPVINFLKYMKNRGLTDVNLPRVPKSVPRTYIPHAFTKQELKGFFNACDNITPRRGNLSAIQRLVIPVFFRLLYSSGIRTTEAILLECEDVNLENGVISIKRGKGYDQHFVVLHDTMLELMIRYDSAISKLLPDRKVFFPTPDDKCHKPIWVTYHFRVLWQQCNKTHAIPYELRHNYAIENINGWKKQGFGIHDKLLALSKSMGHRQIESTLSYYSLTPAVAEILEELDTEMDEPLN